MDAVVSSPLKNSLGDLILSGFLAKAEMVDYIKYIGLSPDKLVLVGADFLETENKITTAKVLLNMFVM